MRAHFTEDGQLGALAATQADAEQEVKKGLDQDDLLACRAGTSALKMALGRKTVSFIGKPGSM